MVLCIRSTVLVRLFQNVMSSRDSSPSPPTPLPPGERGDVAGLTRSRLRCLLGLVLVGVFGATASAQTEKSGKRAPEGEDFFFIAPGFQHEGVPKTVAAEGTGSVVVRVLDKATGKPTPCRIA